MHTESSSQKIHFLSQITSEIEFPADYDKVPTVTQTPFLPDLDLPVPPPIVFRTSDSMILVDGIARLESSRKNNYDLQVIIFEPSRKFIPILNRFFYNSSRLSKIQTEHFAAYIFTLPELYESRYFSLFCAKIKSFHTGSTWLCDNLTAGQASFFYDVSLPFSLYEDVMKLQADCYDLFFKVSKTVSFTASQFRILLAFFLTASRDSFLVKQVEQLLAESDFKGRKSDSKIFLNAFQRIVLPEQLLGRAGLEGNVKRLIDRRFNPTLESYEDAVLNLGFKTSYSHYLQDMELLNNNLTDFYRSLD